jgi:chromosome segregation ATPase
MSSSGSSEENSLADIINPYMRELKMHPKELTLKDGKVRIEDVQGPKGEGNLEARMEELEQEVFRYKKMTEREVDIIHRINQELIAKHKKETAELWDDILSLHETTNKLQAQLYNLQNQNCEYEARFKQMSVAATSRKTLIGGMQFCGALASSAPQKLFLWRTRPGAPQKYSISVAHR